MNDIKPTNPIPVPAYYFENKEDEISLVDLFLILYKRKMVILLILIACTALAVAATFFTTEKTTYTTSIKIGGKPQIESNTNALTKLKETYIPITKDSFKSNDKLVGLNVTARAPENSDLVVLETQSLTTNHDLVEELHKAIAERLIADHDKQLNQNRVAIENQIDRLRLTLDSLKNSTYLTTLRNDVASLRKRYLDSEGLSDNMKLDVKDELRFLQTKLIEEEQSTTMKTIDMQSKINELRYQLETTPKTTLISLALESEKKRRSSLVVIALGIILGGILGIFAAFMIEFIGKVKEEDKKREAEKRA